MMSKRSEKIAVEQGMSQVEVDSPESFIKDVKAEMDRMFALWDAVNILRGLTDEQFVLAVKTTHEAGGTAGNDPKWLAHEVTKIRETDSWLGELRY